VYQYSTRAMATTTMAQGRMCLQHLVGAAVRRHAPPQALASSHRANPLRGRGFIHSFTFQLNLRSFGNTSLTSELNLSTFGPHPRVKLGQMGTK